MAKFKALTKGDAISRAKAILVHQSIKREECPTNHIIRILTARTDDGKALRYFWSVPMKVGRRGGRLIVDRHDDFEERFLKALELEPYERHHGVDWDSLVSPGEQDFEGSQDGEN